MTESLFMTNGQTHRPAGATVAGFGRGDRSVTRRPPASTIVEATCDDRCHYCQGPETD